MSLCDDINIIVDCIILLISICTVQARSDSTPNSELIFNFSKLNFAKSFLSKLLWIILYGPHKCMFY